MAISNQKPLCVDLDGTLIRTDSLIEIWLAVLRSSPIRAITLLGRLSQGKAAFKAAVSQEATIDPQALPYSRPLLDYLETQQRQGRKLYLATAANERIASGIAKYVAVFDGVFASTKTQNLRGEEKARCLVEAFGEQGFSYAGNDVHDLPVWRHAATAITVDLHPRLERRLELPVEHRIPGNRSVRPLLRALRVHQWLKNFLVFLPLITAGALFDMRALLLAGLCFVSFSLTASGVYLLNDLLDLDADRKHPDKRHRPFAAGDLPLTHGLFGAPVLFAAGLLVGLLIGWPLVLVLVGYVALTSLYSAFLKTKPLVDVFTLAFLYTLRVIAGGIATGYEPSVWLLTFTSFLFLSLALLKRYVEFSRETDGARAGGRRGYYDNEAGLLLNLGIASSFAASIVLALYVESTVARQIYARPEFIWGMVPLVLFWQARLWLGAHRGFVYHDPLVYAVRDWVSALVALSAVLLYLAASI